MGSRTVAWREVLVAAIAVEAALMLGHLIVGQPREVDSVRIDAEHSLPTWASSTQFALAAAACALVPAWRWRAVALLLLAFSIDEAVSTHEQLGVRVGFSLSQELLQPAAALVVAAGLAFVARGETGWPRRLLLAGAAVLLCGQLVSTLSSVTDPTGAVGDGLEVVEEWLEMLVGTFLLCAGLAAGGRRAGAG
jgi:hypothetical protein